MQSTNNRKLANQVVIGSATVAAAISIVLLMATGTTNPVHWVLASASVVAAAGVANLIIRRGLTNPLDQLHHALDVASRGGAWREPSRPAGDEIGRLNQSIGRIVEALEHSQDELRQHKSLLEQRVLRRTSELESQTRRTQVAADAQREFLAQMAQDLSHPVKAVLGTIDMVLDTKLTPEQREHLEASQRWAYSAIALLTDILDLARIENGELTLERAPVNVRSVLEDCVRGLQTNVGGKIPNTTSIVDTAVPRRLMGDAMRIRQIFWHLLSNTARMTDGNDLRIWLGYRAAGGDRGQLRLEIRYAGRGIPHEALSIPGSLTEAATTGSALPDVSAPRPGGIGIGLGIARKLVELHGGAVELANDNGIHVLNARLLCEIAEVQPPETSAANAPAPAQAGGDDARGARILVAEDSLVNQKVIAAVLRKRGYRVVVAGDGREAVRIIESSAGDDPVRLVLMDVQMPIMDGLEATRTLRESAEWRKLPIVAMTAHSMSGDRERCFESGMTGYIPKPVHAAHLIRTIEEQLGGAMTEGGSAVDTQRPALEAYPEISQGLFELFVQVAPDRMRRLTSAFEQNDRAAIQAEARKVAAGAERINATQVSGIARRIEEKAPYLEQDVLRSELTALDQALRMLETTAASTNSGV